MIKRRSLAVGVNTDTCNYTFWSSGITNYLRNGGNRDNAQKIAAHEDSRTTALLMNPYFDYQMTINDWLRQ